MFLLNYEVQMPPLKAESSLEIIADIKSGQEQSRGRRTHILLVPASMPLSVFFVKVKEIWACSLGGTFYICYLV